MPVAISIQELRESIIERLKVKHDEEKFSTISVLSRVRNKATLAFADMELTSCDHDFTKLSITSLVSLLCNIPKDISESFYQGQVYVSYKDSVFQPSSALMHSAEWLKCLREKYTILLEMLIIYTDGGADHRTTFGSVQLAMICLFLEGDFDFLAAVRTASYHSWSNPAESTHEEINNLFDILKKVDPTVTQNNTSKNKLRTCVDLQEFIKSHYLVREYSFQIKKCRKNECVICGSIRLPQEIFNQLHFIPDPQISSDPDHYQDFNSLYGCNTTEIDLPSKKNNPVCQELAPDGMLVAARVCDFALCTSCTKLRCIFSKYVLRESDSEILQTAMKMFAYTCGSPIVPENHPLYNKVFVRMNLTCDSPIE
ncbi:hypothetical protein GLOIN_2v1779563 [Rhizophagus irregularis DAOM 181602=DAOM 197198]|uniref:Uncharacterized protein n=1 Tax=Rhizophagus irregularis (strain DAOM 181602 / DAOM 197198 / MUCL 43194) TaxID=747089 RepID=A0A2P4PPL6_RHIID|nr:hypothetical protein GLOIN_2v1779563 [Rhizophagus irregularis DAOM 181602=DAOM 197198]POG67325.1 hypothetical protein GLOIN_2v1779563 [Rhizophagus irregularis DAOM 181602=DAOM 197198]|eukprot:XP_025174191.1 hypothetical protein GLOIN_2v1779563 [Rhizophagus irregularis DAOM 181602=DAOM 197198]